MNISVNLDVSKACIRIKVPMLMVQSSGDSDLIDAAKTRTTPYHPQGDGQMQRLNKSIVKILCKLIEKQQRDGAAYVPKTLLAYNSSVHDSTGYMPYHLMFGREACLPIGCSSQAQQYHWGDWNIPPVCCSAEGANRSNRTVGEREPS